AELAAHAALIRAPSDREAPCPLRTRSGRNRAATSTSSRCAGCGTISFHALGHVPRYCHRAEHPACRAVPDDCKCHFDIELASALVESTGQRGTALKFHGAFGHRGFEAMPVRGPQVLWNNQIEALADSLLR